MAISGGTVRLGACLHDAQGLFAAQERMSATEKDRLMKMSDVWARAGCLVRGHVWDVMASTRGTHVARRPWPHESEDFTKVRCCRCGGWVNCRAMMVG